MSNKKLIPELRFKSFENDWKPTKLEFVFEEVQNPNELSKSYEMLTLSSIYGIRTIKEAGRKDVSSNDKSNYKVVENGNLVCNKMLMWENGFGVSRRVGIISPAYYILKTINNHNVKFFDYTFRSKKSNYVFEFNSQGLGRKRTMGIKTLLNLKFNTPSIEEQNKIANFLTKVDKREKLLEEIRDLKKQYKKGLLQQLFVSNSVGGGALNSPSMRFEGFTEDWKSVKISDIFEVTRGLVLSKKKVKALKDDKNNYPVFSSQTLNKGLMGYYKEYLFEDCITWTTDGANAGNVNLRSGKFYCTNVCGVLKSDKYNNLCVSEILNKEAWKHVLHVGNPKLMNGVISEIKIKIPPTIEEQNKISDYLTKIDKSNNKTKIELEILKDWKKGLLQRLFI